VAVGESAGERWRLRDELSILDGLSLGHRRAAPLLRNALSCPQSRREGAPSHQQPTLGITGTTERVWADCGCNVDQV
jgi:hypothetical protein